MILRKGDDPMKEEYKPRIRVIMVITIWISVIIRIIICLLPQNKWCSDEGNMTLFIIRNGMFAITGIGVIILHNLFDSMIERKLRVLKLLDSFIS